MTTETVNQTIETVKEIKNNRLLELMEEIETSFKEIQNNENQTNAQKIIFHAKKIEIGEKKLKKEFMKREKQLQQIQHEISVIQNLAQKVGYNLEG